MQVVRFEDVRAFAERAQPYLMAHEAIHCLPLGLAASLVRDHDPDAVLPYMALVEDADRILCVALRTPPFNLILSLPAPGTTEDDLTRAIASDLRRAGPDLSGVIGPAAMSQSFARAWHELTGAPAHLDTREGIYELSAVRPPSGVPGAYRLATREDRPLLIDWLTAFNAEALPNAPASDALEWADRALASPTRTLALWEDGGAPVALAGAGNPTPHGIRIGPVYTPPANRGRGYASALVAELSQRQLASGRRFCFLYTDLANPTANHIYQTIGYRQVAEAEVYRFGLA